MTTMIDRVAIALYKNDGYTLAIYSNAEESWNADRENVRERYRKEAYVVIGTLREPTEEMAVVGDGRIIEALNDHGFALREKTPAYESWTAMIDAALAEEGDSKKCP